MKDLITEFREIGNCTIDVDKLCGEWSDKFYISKYHEEYSLVRYGRAKSYSEVSISIEQAREIIDRLRLLPIQSSTFVHAISYKKREFIEVEIDRVNKLMEEKQLELSVISDVLLNLNEAIFNF